MDDHVKIRVAATDDAAKLLEIYRPYVEETAISFEYEVPSLDEFTARMEKTLKKYPYIVAEVDGVLSGYAYTGPFVGRAAYDRAAETTIYLKEDKRKTGLGRRLYGAIEDICRAQNITNLYACIGYPEVEDQYLTKNSVQFHAHLGYRLVGTFQKCGYKFDRWYDMVWMEKIIGIHSPVPAAVVPFPDLDTEVLRGIGIQ